MTRHVSLFLASLVFCATMGCEEKKKDSEPSKKTQTATGRVGGRGGSSLGDNVPSSGNDSTGTNAPQPGRPPPPTPPATPSTSDVTSTPEYAGGCAVPSTRTCVEYWGVSREEASSDCQVAEGTFVAEEECPRADTIGACVIGDASQYAAVLVYRMPDLTDQDRAAWAQTWCVSEEGVNRVWTTPEG